MVSRTLNSPIQMKEGGHGILQDQKPEQQDCTILSPSKRTSLSEHVQHRTVSLPRSTDGLSADDLSTLGSASTHKNDDNIETFLERMMMMQEDSERKSSKIEGTSKVDSFLQPQSPRAGKHKSSNSADDILEEMSDSIRDAGFFSDIPISTTATSDIVFEPQTPVWHQSFQLSSPGTSLFSANTAENNQRSQSSISWGKNKQMNSCSSGDFSFESKTSQDWTGKTTIFGNTEQRQKTIALDPPKNDSPAAFASPRTINRLTADLLKAPSVPALFSPPPASSRRVSVPSMPVSVPLSQQKSTANPVLLFQKNIPNHNNNMGTPRAENRRQLLAAIKRGRDHAKKYQSESEDFLKSCSVPNMSEAPRHSRQRGTAASPARSKQGKESRRSSSQPRSSHRRKSIKNASPSPARSYHHRLSPSPRRSSSRRSSLTHVPMNNNGSNISRRKVRGRPEIFERAYPDGDCEPLTNTHEQETSKETSCSNYSRDTERPSRYGRSRSPVPLTSPRQQHRSRRSRSSSPEPSSPRSTNPKIAISYVSPSRSNSPNKKQAIKLLADLPPPPECSPSKRRSRSLDDFPLTPAPDDGEEEKELLSADTSRRPRNSGCRRNSSSPRPRCGNLDARHDVEESSRHRRKSSPRPRRRSLDYLPPSTDEEGSSRHRRKSASRSPRPGSGHQGRSQSQGRSSRNPRSPPSSESKQSRSASAPRSLRSPRHHDLSTSNPGLVRSLRCKSRESKISGNYTNTIGKSSGEGTEHKKDPKKSQTPNHRSSSRPRSSKKLRDDCRSRSRPRSSSNIDDGSSCPTKDNEKSSSRSRSRPRSSRHLRQPSKGIESDKDQRSSSRPRSSRKLRENSPCSKSTNSKDLTVGSCGNSENATTGTHQHDRSSSAPRNSRSGLENSTDGCSKGNSSRSPKRTRPPSSPAKRREMTSISDFAPKTHTRKTEQSTTLFRLRSSPRKSTTSKGTRLPLGDDLPPITPRHQKSRLLVEIKSSSDDVTEIDDCAPSRPGMSPIICSRVSRGVGSTSTRKERISGAGGNASRIKSTSAANVFVQGIT